VHSSAYGTELLATAEWVCCKFEWEFIAGHRETPSRVSLNSTRTSNMCSLACKAAALILPLRCLGRSTAFKAHWPWVAYCWRLTIVPGPCIRSEARLCRTDSIAVCTQAVIFSQILRGAAVDGSTNSCPGCQPIPPCRCLRATIKVD